MTDERRITNEDFDNWQQANLPLTSDAQTYQLVREIAVDFSNAVFPSKVAAERDAERERCCQDVCGHCERGEIPKLRPYIPDVFIDPILNPTDWFHNDGTNCAAAAIRSRVATKEKKE